MAGQQQLAGGLLQARRRLRAQPVRQDGLRVELLDAAAHIALQVEGRQVEGMLPIGLVGVLGTLWAASEGSYGRPVGPQRPPPALVPRAPPAGKRAAHRGAPLSHPWLPAGAGQA